jgi:cell division protease FtsH
VLALGVGGVIAALLVGLAGTLWQARAARRSELLALREAYSANLFLADSAIERIQLGAARRIMLSKEERERTAYHESGHAVLGMLEPGADPVRKVSIVPRGRALGVTFQSPDADRYGYGEEYLRGRIIGALGGRAAEEIVYGDVTTGAESDLEQVTRIARQMVGRWGMSDKIGLVSVLPRPEDEGSYFPSSASASESTRELVDSEVRRIVEECYVEAVTKLRENRDRLEALTQALLEHETLDELDAYRAAGFERPPREDASDIAKAAALSREAADGKPEAG